MIEQDETESTFPWYLKMKTKGGEGFQIAKVYQQLKGSTGCFSTLKSEREVRLTNEIDLRVGLGRTRSCVSDQETILA